MNEHDLRDLFALSCDVVVKSYQLSETHPNGRVLLLYCEGMINMDHIENLVLPKLEGLFRNELDVKAYKLHMSTMLQLHEITDSNAIESMTVS